MAESKRSPEVAAEICAWIAEGKTYADLRRSNPDRYAHKTEIGRWRKADPEFDAAYLEARDLGFDVIAEDVLNIVDAKVDDPACRRVRAEYRLKLLAKWDPRRYGDKIQTEHSGSMEVVTKFKLAPLE